jgi:uncharacterized protein (DUF1800 family)
MAVTNQLKNQHLLWRAAFGPMAENATELSDTSPKALYSLLAKASAKVPENLNVASGAMDGLLKGIKDVIKIESLSKEQKQMLRKQSREDLQSLNLNWLDKMINSEAQLREKMSLFWHGHFACRVINIYFQQQLLDMIRKNTLGNFGDLLREVSKSAAMLSFLNNQQNKKEHPNENFAREIMELFTMGRGNYSEQDVKEAARAFTGWGFNVRGEFVKRPFDHDSGYKTFLGKTGNFDGDDIIDILLEQKQTAKFISTKIYRFFVNEEIDNDKVTALAEIFYQSGYDIQKLLEVIFTSSWFYDRKNIGNKIKSPIELLAGIRRLIPMEIENEDAQLLFQRVLGQMLFYPPNVAGWPGGKNWIDSSSLMIRLNIPYLLTRSSNFYVTPKNDDDNVMGMEESNRVKAKMNQVQSNVNWSPIITAFENVPTENLADAVSSLVLQTKTKISNHVLEHSINKDSRENYIKTIIVELMSTPEYQLC